MGCLRAGGFCLLLFTMAVRAQFPTVCVTPDALATMTCCPNHCGGPLRGRCQDVSEYLCYPDASLGYDQLRKIAYPGVLEFVKLLNESSTETRYLWPTKVFKRVCTCVGHFAGADCSECKWGYVESPQGDCVRDTSTKFVRRNYLSLSRADQKRHISALAKSRNVTSRYSVITHQPDRAKGETFTVDDFVSNGSVYDVIAWIHFFSSKDRPSIDFAHRRSAFLTWHRWFLLFVEREIRWVTGDSSFTLPYWDWANKSTRHKMFDGTTYAGTGCKLCGEFANFDIKCSRTMRLLSSHKPAPFCSTEIFWASPDLVTRNVSGFTRFSFSILFPDFPSKTDVYDALQLGIKYDAYPYNSPGTNNVSFRNLLEGSALLPNKTYCPGQNKALELHDDVHVFIGRTMAFVPASAFDPIFWPHHSNVDRIFEMWIRAKQADWTWYRPRNAGAPGHNGKDCIVPAFPLVKNDEMLEKSTDLGYTYDDLKPPTRPVVPENPAELVCLSLGGKPAPLPVYACDCPPPSSSNIKSTKVAEGVTHSAIFFACFLLTLLTCIAILIVSA